MSLLIFIVNNVAFMWIKKDLKRIQQNIKYICTGNGSMEKQWI